MCLSVSTEAGRRGAVGFIFFPPSEPALAARQLKTNCWREEKLSVMNHLALCNLYLGERANVI